MTTVPLDAEQRIGVFMTLKQLGERGYGSLEEVREVRAFRQRVAPETEAQQTEAGQVMAAEPMEIELSEREAEILQDGVDIIARQMEDRDTPVPAWLAAADEVVQKARD